MLLADPQLLPMLGGTLWVAGGVALMSVVIGLPLGVLRGLFNVPLPRLWDLLFLIPFLTPYIAALSWMLVLQSNGYLQQLTGWDLNDLLFSRSGIVLVMTFNIFPVVYFAVSRSLLASGSGWRSSRAFTAPAPGGPSGILRCRCFPRRWQGCCWRLPWRLRSLASRRRWARGPGW
jgi:ABC-type Fe3+ transport system permease subunit